MAFTPEEEHDIEIAAEARYRAAKRLRDEEKAEAIKKACKRGEHEYENGVCVHCKAKEPVKVPEKKKSKWL